MRTLKILLVSLTIFFASSCQTGIKFNPDFHKATSAEQAIVDERGNRIYSDEPEFDNFACMHKEKIKELAEILKKARIPKEEKEIILKKINNLRKKFR